MVEPLAAEQALYDTVMRAVRAVHAAASEQPGKGRMALRLLLEQAGSSAEAVRDALSRAQAQGDVRLPLAKELARAAQAAGAAGSSKLAKLRELTAALPAIDPGSKTEPAFAAALQVCAGQAEHLAGGFRAAMTRRFARDRLRIEGYFEELERELGRRAGRGRLDAGAIDDKRRRKLPRGDAPRTVLTEAFGDRAAPHVVSPSFRWCCTTVRE